MPLLTFSFVLATAFLGPAGAAEARPRPAAAIVADIMRADYEGNLAALLRLQDELVVPAEPARDVARIRYWRGFARWRRAINGANDAAPVAQMMEDLQAAVREFDSALESDPQFTDARAALLSSLGIQLFLLKDDTERMAPLIARARPMVVELRAEGRPNPRVAWVLGQVLWRTPPGSSADQILARHEEVIASYVRALNAMRKDADTGSSELDPRWGEPELLMSLAWSSLNKAAPDVAAAERYAREALARVPHWHYVRDILLPQIERARPR